MVDVLTLVVMGNDEDLMTALDDNDTLQLFSTPDGIATCHLAAMMGHYSTIEILLDKGINVNCLNNDGNTMLHSAARFGNVALAFMLFDRNIDINIRNIDNETALHWASINGHTGVAMLLSSVGINISDDINEYAPHENEEEEAEDGGVIYYDDCRPMIFEELENRRKRALYDSFVNRHIEYQPYIDNIFALCYPGCSRENVRVARPAVGTTTTTTTTTAITIIIITITNRLEQKK